MLSRVLRQPKEYLIAHPELELSWEQVQVFSACVDRLLKGEPLAYITGEREFWDLTFLCSPSALIPRPESELLVEKALALTEGKRVETLIDLGTGTGAIGITLASIWRDTYVVLTDISLEALLLARRNCIKILGSSRCVSFICCNWLEGFRPGVKADIITANPPYVSKNDTYLLQENVRRYEPERALFATDKLGLSEIRKIFRQAPQHLKRGGVILCEIGIGQCQKVIHFIKGLQIYRHIQVFKDLSGIDRVIAARL